jgi:hypothetical protein
MVHKKWSKRPTIQEIVTTLYAYKGWVKKPSIPTLTLDISSPNYLSSADTIEEIKKNLIKD